MISEHHKIFRNLPHQRILTFQQAQDQGDWSDFPFILKKSPLDLLKVIRLSKLRERDEKAELVADKWESLRQKGGAPFLVIDGSAGLPGDESSYALTLYETYKIIEGSVLTAFALGITQGYFYIPLNRAEDLRVVQDALDQSYAQGFLGKKIVGENFSFDLHIHYGARDYVSYCEQGIMTSLAGEYQSIGHLFGQPVLMHKVETVASLGAIIRRGAEWFSSIGTRESTGTKVFSFSGHVNKPCVIEESLGCSLRTAVDQYAGGVRGGWSHLYCIFPSGLLSPLLFKHSCDELKLSYESLEASSSYVGNGAIIVMNQSTDMRALILQSLDFFRYLPPSVCLFCSKGLLSCADTFNVSIHAEEVERENSFRALTSLFYSLENRCECGYFSKASILLKGLLRICGERARPRTQQAPLSHYSWGQDSL